MEYQSLTEIVTDMPIFGTLSVSLSENSGEDFKKALNILFFTDKIRIKCVECDDFCPFEVSHSITKDTKESDYKYGPNLSWNFTNLDSDIFFRNSVTLPKHDEGIIIYTFKCTMNSRHYQKMYLLYTLEKGKLVFRKIGQKPLNSDLKEKMSNEYKNILEKYDSFDDFRHFEQSESRDLLAGSCVYLRRILEKMVNVFLCDPSVSDEAKKDAIRFEDKYALVKNRFDVSIQEMINNSYSLLSKGVHELSNDEIKQFYVLMLQVICIQLEYEKEAEETAKKRKLLKKNIDLAISRFGKK